MYGPHSQVRLLFISFVSVSLDVRSLYLLCSDVYSCSIFLFIFFLFFNNSVYFTFLFFSIISVHFILFLLLCTLYIYVQLFYLHFSHDVAVLQWITSCHKNHMTTRVITLWGACLTSLTTSVSTMPFHIELIIILKAIKSRFKGPYEKQNLTLVVISYQSII